ncbi:hypothetical protein HMPREF1152_0832 [Mogibacterium sp. CM50]|nr:hypothetical protein HMPREF1152_0832 [Mogibacterium sp. CM50]
MVFTGIGITEKTSIRSKSLLCDLIIKFSCLMILEHNPGMTVEHNHIYYSYITKFPTFPDNYFV